MAGAGFKTFTAGEVLTASDVNTYLQEQTVMNFAGTAARASALPSPSEGMVTHIGGGTVEVYDGATWVDIAPTPVSDSGLVLIDEESFSAVSSVSLNNVFSATYQNYLITVAQTGSAPSNDVRIRYRVSGSDAATSYAHNAVYSTHTTGPAREYSTGQTFHIIGQVSDEGGFHVLHLNGVASAVRTVGVVTASCWSGASAINWNATTIHGVATAYDGITIYPSTGTFTGTVRVYGYKGA